MRLDTVTAEIRPRSDWEAVDLGFAMVRRDFWRCFVMWWLALIVPVGLAAVFLNDHPLLVLGLLWWWKPAGSRMVLFQLSRRLFGENPSWRDVWREVPRAWTRRFFHRFIVARLSPWLPVTIAVEDLEGLRGQAYRQRSKQVIRRGEGPLMWFYLIADVASAWGGFGILQLIRMMIPEGQDGAWAIAIEQWDPSDPANVPLLISRTIAICVAVAMSLTDLFVIGAGFGVYINNRTWIEGWDIELAFKRLAQRLGKAAVVLLCAGLCMGSLHAAKTPEDSMRDIKADPAFKVHVVIEKVPKSKSTSSSSFVIPDWFAWMFTICAIALVVGFLGWMLWRNRHVFVLRRGTGGEGDKDKTPGARVVLGMPISPESLPADVPAAAWLLWQRGEYQQALGLLYRGAISCVVDQAAVEIQESDTEGDCMRRVEAAGQPAHPGYFRGITGTWMRLAYAGIVPPQHEVAALCEQWPFAGRGQR